MELYHTRYGKQKNLEFTKGGEENQYTAQLPGSELPVGDYVVTSIRVEDERNNYVDGEVIREDGTYLYQFSIQNKPIEGKITISDLKVERKPSNEDGTLKTGDSVIYTANVQCEGENVSLARMYFTCQDNNSERKFFSVTYKEETGELCGTFGVGDKTYPGEWSLDRIEIYTSSSRYLDFYPKDIAPETDVKFTVNQAYDQEPPVIERIDIGENGREVKAGETVEIKVKVKEEHPNTSMTAEFGPSEYGQNPRRVNLTYDAKAQEYVGQVEITQFTYPCEWELTYLYVYDTYGNRASLSDFQGDEPEEGRWYYSVSPDGYDAEKPVITGIRLEPDGRDVKAGDTVILKVEAEEPNPYNGTAQLIMEDLEYPITEFINLSYREDDRAYVGRMEIKASTYPGQWRLADLSIYDKNRNVAKLSEYEELEQKGPWCFNVDESGYDVNGPVVESITLDKNGQFVKSGDMLGIRIKISEKNPNEYDVMHAYFHPQVANVSASLDVSLRYNPAEKEYVGTIPITDDTYPCEWALTELDIRDRLGYRYSMSEKLCNWQSTAPWYFRVKSGNTYREDVKNVSFSIYGLMEQEDGSYDFGYTNRTAEKVGRRATLKELGVLPQPFEGVTVTWRYNWAGIEAEEDTELLFNSTDDMNCSLVASYDKGCANVSLTYVSAENGQKTVVIPVFIDKDATYREVLAALELPSDAKTDDFAEFLLSYSDSAHNWNTKVGDVTRISVVADYKNCQTTWNTRYIGQDGQEAARVITKSYKEGTTVADALAELENPQDVVGMEGEGWTLLGADEEQVLSKEMVSFDVVALYRGRTTLDVSYTYRGEDGTIAGGSKLLAMEGENLSDAEIQGEATNAFKDASHLPGLMLSEWAGAIDVSQKRYQKIRFQAQYYNCVVVLKYPDETCQYVIVDKNTEFTLPTENEFYTDIQWEGFGQGQTVTITEDREFLVSDANRKNGTEEVPEGERLTEEEIAKIKQEIEEADAGASVKVDMKKATVVPKEVLESIKGKSVELVLDMGIYSWSIDGAEVNATDLKDIDLEVTIGTDQIPSALVSSIAEGKPVTQLSLTHNGEFGFRADLTLNLGSENHGSYGNLYYYDSSGKLVFRNAGQIGADGLTTLSFSHASDYVAVVDKVMHTSNGAGGDNEIPDGTGSGDNESTGKTDSSDNKTPGGTGSNDSGNPGGTDNSDNRIPGGTDSSGNEVPGGTDSSDNEIPGGTDSSDQETTDGADSNDKEKEKGTAAEPDDGEKEGADGAKDKEEGKKDKDNIIPRETEKKEPTELAETETGKSDEEDASATKEKNTYHVTADSGRTSFAGTGAGSLKSPKTGE